MKRVIWLVLDSLGIGNGKDATKFDDKNSDTLGNIAKYYSNNKGLYIPNLSSLGLVKAYEANNKDKKLKLNLYEEPKLLSEAFWGYANELSKGKDTPSGHWEMAGYPVLFEWHYFTSQKNSFPTEILDKLKQESGIADILGNCHASGTEIISRLGVEHIKTKYPIIYTSADSVMQIAAHEEVFGLENLYKLCEMSREILNKYEYNVCRVIARPFKGDETIGFTRTNNRHDYTTPPLEETVLDIALKNNKEVISIGKIYDIFAGRGISKQVKAYGLENIFSETLKQMQLLKNDGIIYVNFVDFDMTYGHRRDIQGYAKEIEKFDLIIKDVIAKLQANDLLILTADHGCDPSWHGSDHTREAVPVFGLCKSRNIGAIGARNTFADIAKTISEYLEIESTPHGVSFLK